MKVKEGIDTEDKGFEDRCFDGHAVRNVLFYEYIGSVTTGFDRCPRV